MKPAHLYLSILLSLGLTACSDDDEKNSGSLQPPVTQPDQPAPEPNIPDEEVPIPEVLLDENFDKWTALSGDWIQPKNNAGQVYLENGDLYIDGRAHSTQMTTLLLPEKFQQLRNYRIDMEFSFEEALNEARWGSIIYRGADQFADPSFTPLLPVCHAGCYHQC